MSRDGADSVVPLAVPREVVPMPSCRRSRVARNGRGDGAWLREPLTSRGPTRRGLGSRDAYERSVRSYRLASAGMGARPW